LEFSQVYFERQAIIMASIILAEEYVLVRQGLRRIIQKDPAVQVTHETGDGLELLALLKESTPDMVILDILATLEPENGTMINARTPILGRAC
jgi:DNA-binding NarL/FixJ family response regulator